MRFLLACLLAVFTAALSACVGHDDSNSRGGPADCDDVWIELIEPVGGAGTWGAEPPVVKAALPDPLVRAWAEIDGAPVAELVLGGVVQAEPSVGPNGWAPVWEARIAPGLLSTMEPVTLTIRAAEGYCEATASVTFIRD